MTDIIGFLTAVLVLVAALFGLIPPIASTDKYVGRFPLSNSVLSLVGVIKNGIILAGCLFIFFYYIEGIQKIIERKTGETILTLMKLQI